MDNYCFPIAYQIDLKLGGKMKRRVVITGMGVISPIGLGVKLFWEI